MPRRMVTTLLTIAGVLVVGYLGFLALLWRMQERIVFQPPRRPVVEDTASGSFEYTSRDGIRLVSYVVQAERASGPVIVAFHGNAMIARWMIPWAREIAHRFHATVVLPEYRGYDGLEGTPTYEGAGLDARAALEATEKRFHVAPGHLVYYGHSLGTAIATELASVSPPKSLLLESPFTSAQEMAARMPVVGLSLFWSTISRVHYATRDRVAELDVPVSVAHGARDMIVPSRMGEAVFAAARRKGRLLIIAEGDHNDVPIAGGDAYWRWFGEALQGRSH